MSVGRQPSSNDIDAQITALALQMRNVLQAAADLSTYVNGQGAGLATLEAAGYGGTDAATALSAIGYLNTVAQLYFGNATQGSAFNFSQELSQYWGVN
jgi:hypothetical protein